MSSCEERPLSEMMMTADFLKCQICLEKKKQQQTFQMYSNVVLTVCFQKGLMQTFIVKMTFNF